ncbi:MAG: hypothetical protein JWL91_1596 [Sphingomonas bacterium]|nr:hypothetical protein [Sphingomonas bacterium]MDB5689720.1 hypothetical protein [Sphingomonas bacterium]
MKRFILLIAVASGIGAGSTNAQARAPRDEDAVYGSRRAGQLRPLPEIERMVVPRMGGARYIGPEILDDVHYRLKFMRGSKVIWVDVDGRTGAIVGRTGD